MNTPHFYLGTLSCLTNANHKVGQLLVYLAMDIYSICTGRLFAIPTKEGLLPDIEVN